jgi:hypothetical protein
VYTTSSLSTSGDMPYRGPGLPIKVPRREQGDPSLLAAQEFIACLRNDTRPSADEIVAWNEGVAVVLGVEAVRTGTRVDFAQRGVTVPPGALAA